MQASRLRRNQAGRRISLLATLFHVRCEKRVGGRGLTIRGWKLNAALGLEQDSNGLDAAGTVGMGLLGMSSREAKRAKAASVGRVYVGDIRVCLARRCHGEQLRVFVMEFDGT